MQKNTIEFKGGLRLIKVQKSGAEIHNPYTWYALGRILPE